MQSFCYRQKQECVDMAAVMINLLKPQFEQYREVISTEQKPSESAPTNAVDPI